MSELYRKKKVIFVDRDGTINVDRGYVYKIRDWQFIGGVVEGLKLMQSRGYKLAVVTNQSGIGHGLYTEEAMLRLHDYMNERLAENGVAIDAVAYCPHSRNSDCECRKPRPGMAKQIEEQLGAIDYKASWMIGDKPLDVGFGQAVGTKTVLLKSKYWQEDGRLVERPDVIANNLYDAAREIVSSVKCRA